MTKLLSRIAGSLLLLAVGCAGGGESHPPAAEQGTPAGATEDAANADRGTQLPLVIAPVTGDSDPATEENEEVDLARIAKLQEDVDANPDDPDRHRALAIALHGAQRKDRAIPHFERLVELRPDQRSLLDLALAYNSVSRIAEAEATYARLLELSPGNSLALHNLGAMEAKRGEFSKAISFYRQALASDPDYLLAQYHLAKTLERDGQFKEAYAAFAAVIELEPANATDASLYDDALYRAASLDITMGAHERAAEMLAELISANPDHESAHYAYGQVLLQLGRIEEAQKEFEEHMRVLSEQHPQSPVAMGD